jgi:hypothetical protein
MRTNRMHYLLSIYFDNQPLHVSRRFTAHRQEVYYSVYIQQLVYVPAFMLLGCRKGRDGPVK